MGYEVCSLEISEKSETIFEVEKKDKMAIILGNEVSGISKEAEGLSSKIIEIPMRGKKESLNVAVTAGIAMFYLSIQ